MRYQGQREAAVDHSSGYVTPRLLQNLYRFVGLRQASPTSPGDQL